MKASQLHGHEHLRFSSTNQAFCWHLSLPCFLIDEKIKANGRRKRDFPNKLVAVQAVGSAARAHGAALHLVLSAALHGNCLENQVK